MRVFILTNIRENPSITTQKFLFLVYEGYYNTFESSEDIKK